MDEMSASSFAKIESTEIQLIKVLGKGAFGTVKQGTWKGRRVAIKIYETLDKQKKDFCIELKQLSRVSHPNIVRLIGFVEETRFTALVMECADGGSLYDVLHKDVEVSYSLWHVMSWLVQCADGISYMHTKRPKPLIHRDLKSLNLLLGRGGTRLKICDFGTVCDLRSKMTTSKGSIAWMAPEVFRSNKYSEKCDVYSWGIILWELLSRRMPWQEYNDSPYTIMWVVGFNGDRPPLINGCPALIQNLLTKCWSDDPKERPSMLELELTLEQLIHFCPKPESEQILCTSQTDEDIPPNNYDRLDVHMNTHFTDMNEKSGEMSIDDNSIFQNKRIANRITKSHSDESLESISSRSPHQSLKRFYSDGNALKQSQYINASSHVSKDFKNFETNVKQESELMPRLQYTECRQLKPIYESHKTHFESYLQLRSDRMVLLSRRQQLENCHQILDKQKIQKCLEDENHSLNQLKKVLITRFEEIRLKRKEEEDIDNGWEVIGHKMDIY